MNYAKIMLISLSTLMVATMQATWSDYTYIDEIENQTAQDLYIGSSVTEGDGEKKIMTDPIDKIWSNSSYPYCGTNKCIKLNSGQTIKLRGWLIPYEKWLQTGYKNIFQTISIQNKSYTKLQRIEITERANRIKVRYIEREFDKVDPDLDQITISDHKDLAPAMHSRAYKVIIKSNFTIELKLLN